MIKTVFITNIHEIKSIKATCAKCGFAMIVSVDHKSTFPHKCPSCMVEFIQSDVTDLLMAVQVLQNSEYLDVEIETEVEIR